VPTTFTYDAAGRLRTSTDRNGRVTTYEYDERNRIRQIAFPDATQKRVYDAAGRLSRIDEGTSAVEYAYDALNRLVAETQDVGGFVNRIEYQYDALDRMVRRTLNGAEAVAYDYDKAGRPRSIGYRDQSTTYQWDAAGRLVGRTLPNGVTQEYAYDEADRVMRVSYRKSDDSTIESVSYAYDAAGQIIRRSLSQASAAETPFSAQYDETNRMTSFTLTATNATYTLSYDDNGNLLRKANAADPADVSAYTWDARNRLVGINSAGVVATFRYDAQGRRAERTINGETTRYVYDGAQAIAEVRATQTVMLHTGLLIDEAIARYTTSDGRVYLTDALGSIIAQTRENQDTQNFYAYSAFGETIAVGTDENNSIQYTARENDGTGLYYFRARYYDPALKRFLTEDPIGLQGGLNTYSYVRNNPLSYSDPTGEAWQWVLVRIVVGQVVRYIWKRIWVEDEPPPCTGFCGGGGQTGGGGASGGWGCLHDCQEMMSWYFRQCVEQGNFTTIAFEYCWVRVRDYCNIVCEDEPCDPPPPGGGGPGGGGQGGAGGRGSGRGGGASGSW
jgi:RHS repeat-associated protein